MSKKTVLIGVGIAAAVIAVMVLRKRFAAQWAVAKNKAAAVAPTERASIDTDDREPVFKAE